MPPDEMMPKFWPPDWNEEKKKAYHSELTDGWDYSDTLLDPETPEQRAGRIADERAAKAFRYESLADDVIKTLAQDLYAGRLFTSRHLGQEYHLLRSVFMPLIFLRRCWVEAYLREGVAVFYEQLSEAGPRGINGYPMFMSMHFLNGADWLRIVEKHDQIKAAVDAL